VKGIIHCFQLQKNQADFNGTSGKNSSEQTYALAFPQRWGT